MLKLDRYRTALSILLAAIPAAGTAQEAADVLAPVAESLQLDTVSAIRFVAAGSGYDAVEAAAAAQRDVADGSGDDAADGAGRSAPSAAATSADAAPETGADAEAPNFLARTAAALAGAAEIVPEALRGATLPEAPSPFEERAADAESEAAAADEAADEADGPTADGPTADGPTADGPTYVLRHYRVEQHVEEVDLENGTLRIERRRAAGPAGDAGRADSSEIGPDAPWGERLAYWTHPAAFVGGALEHGAEVEQQTVAGTDYRVVRFTPRSGNEVRGYIDGDQRLVRIGTTFEAETGGSAAVEVSWLDWEAHENLVFPTLLIRKIDGELVDVLVVQDVEVNPGRTEAGRGG